MKIRLAKMSDADFLLKLKNDPVMRKYAVVTHDKITPEAHKLWLFRNLRTIQIIEESSQRIGMLRITNNNEVSINLDPSCRGKGVGSKVLAKFCPKGVWAKIVDGNVPSMRIFLKNGFQITAHKNNYYVLQN